MARDIAAALGGMREEEGYFEGDDTVVTFAVGHLFELLEPQEVDERFKAWTLDVLPILPERFQVKKKKGQSERIRVIKKLLERDDVDRVINACDAGREGELIFREIVEFLGNEKPTFRLWLQSMTRDSIRRGFTELRPGEELTGLADAAKCRAHADWLIGMNATRALTKRLKSRKERTAWSAGRVQTPTLALLVEREREVLAHVPVPFHRITAEFTHDDHPYMGTYFDPAFKANDDDSRRDDRIFDEAEARAIVDAVRGSDAVAEETRKPSREAAPPLFDLTSLQREGNRRFGWSARRVLGAAQRCYEAHKLLTYPRTDSRCLPNDYRQTVDELLQTFAGFGDEHADYAAGAKRLLEQGLENDQRVFNDAGVSDHFAIIPTGNPPPDSLSGDDRRLFDLVTRRFLATFHPPARWERVERVTRAAGHAFRTRARALKEPGWRACLAKSEEDEATVLPPLQVGADKAEDVSVTSGDVELHSEETRPPARLSEARLLGLMENAGRTVEDEEIAEVMKSTGLGTPATRAEIIENLITKGYAVRQGKSLRPSVKGIRLIDTLERIQIDRLASARLTGEIESHLRDVERGERGAGDFMQEMADYACAIVDRAKTFEYDELYGHEEPIGICPHGGKPVVEGAWFYSCEKDPSLAREDKANPDCPLDSCPMLLWKDSFGRYLDRGSAAAILRDGKTGVLDGFTARNGRTYKGVLEFDVDEGKLTVTSEGWNEDSVSEVAEYEVNSEPLGACPIGKDCTVFETPTHFVCTEKKREEDEKAAYKEARKLAKERGEKAPPKPEKPDHAGFILPRTVCKREITRDEATVYLETGKTELLEDFTSRLGRPFSATLFLKDTGRHGFEFPPRKARGATADADQADTTKARGKKATGKKATGKKTTRKKTTRKKTTRKKAAAKTATRKKTTRKKAAAKKTASTDDDAE